MVEDYERGEPSLGELRAKDHRKPQKCLRDQRFDNNIQGPCSAGACQWPHCLESSFSAIPEQKP